MSQLTSGNTLGFLLTDTARLFRQFFEKVVAENGLDLTPGEIRTLANVIRFRGSRQAALAERMGVEPMTLSAYLDRLEARSLIRRNVDPTDRRAKIVEPESSAFSTMQTLEPQFDLVYAHATQGLSEDQIGAMVKGLQVLRANLTSDPELLVKLDLLCPPPPYRDRVD